MRSGTARKKELNAEGDWMGSGMKADLLFRRTDQFFYGRENMKIAFTGDENGLTFGGEGGMPNR